MMLAGTSALSFARAGRERQAIVKDTVKRHLPGNRRLLRRDTAA
jgi:hypothetical protein